MSNETPLRLKVIEVHNSASPPDVLIADEGANVRDVMLGKEAVYGQVADRLTGDIIVKSVNCFPEMLEALKAIQEWLLSDCPVKPEKFWNENFVKANNLTAAVIAKAEGRNV